MSMSDDDKAFFESLFNRLAEDKKCTNCICVGEEGILRHNQDHEFVRKAMQAVSRFDEYQRTGMKSVIAFASVAVFGWILWKLFGISLGGK